MYTSFGSQIALKYSRVRFVRRTRTHANIHAANWARETAADKWEWCKTMLIIASLHSHYSASESAPTLSYLRPRARTQNTCMYTALKYTQEYSGGCALREYLLAKRCTRKRASQLVDLTSAFSNACYLFIHWAVRDSSYPLKQRHARFLEKLQIIRFWSALCAELDMRCAG